VNLLIDGIDNYGFLHNFAVLTTCHHGCHAMGEARGGSRRRVGVAHIVGLLGAASGEQ